MDPGAIIFFEFLIDLYKAVGVYALMFAQLKLKFSGFIKDVYMSPALVSALPAKLNVDQVQPFPGCKALPLPWVAVCEL